MKNLKTLIAAIGIAVVPVSASGQQAGDPQLGRKFALKVCAECHAVLPGNTISPQAGAPAFRTIANTRGMSRIALITWFQTPHKEMPNLMLDAGDKDDLIAYITSLRHEDD